MEELTLTIGAAAREAGVSVETVRYYQRIGLIEEPAKPVGGFRLYSKAILDDILFIKKAQRIGFTLAEIRALLQGDKNCAETKELAQNKLLDIRSKIAELQSVADILEHLLGTCHSGEGVCSIVESLRDNNLPLPPSESSSSVNADRAAMCCSK